MIFRPVNVAPNRLLMGLMVVSFGLHLLFIYLGDGLRPERTAYIEFSLQDASPAATRPIPRPRIRNRVPELRHALNLSSRKHNVAPARMESVKRPDPVRPETDVIPDIPGFPDVTGLNAADWADGSGAESGGITQKDYFEIVRLKIESRKKYPETARARHIEGRVTVRFALDAGGRIEKAMVVKSSGHATLDQAAVAAVKNASPFPQPPKGLFKEKLQMTIVIVFELT